MQSQYFNELGKLGRVWLRGAVGEAELATIEKEWQPDGRPGVRLMPSPALARVLAPDGAVGRLVQDVLPGGRPVRAVAFNKTAQANWGLPWHQDRVIAVRERQDVPGYGPWSRKDGVWHCEPPLEVLRRMVFLRLHLDDTDTENGCLELALGSHRRGAVAAADAEGLSQGAHREVCVARRGDVLVVDMLTLHRSRPSRAPGNRRVIRVDYAAGPLPPPLAWLAVSPETAMP